MIYQPAEDSFLLSAEIKKKARGKKVLDVGSGSGILAENALAGGASDVLCVDVDSEVVDFLRRKGLKAVKSDLFSKIKGKYDLIVFNPPYLPFDSREDFESQRITTGGVNGDEIIVRFLEGAGKYLAYEGKILLLVSSLTPLKRIDKVLKIKGFEKEIISSKKLFMERLEVWEIRKN